MSDERRPDERRADERRTEPERGDDRIEKIVIVGTGIAGATAARTLRQAGFTGSIRLFGEEPHLPYRRPPLSKEVLVSSEEPRTQLMPVRVWADQAIDVFTGSRVTRLLPDRQQVVTDSGEAVDYDRLLIATGSRPRVPLGAADMPGLHCLRTLDDARALRAALATSRPLIVVGAGLIGLEAAAAARSLGCDVTVLEAADRVLGRVLPQQFGRALADLHIAKGVDLRTGVNLVGLDKTADGSLRLIAAGGETWNAPTVLAAIGAAPDTALVESCGMKLAPGGGIVVDEHGRTSIPGIYAAGDVAEAADPLAPGGFRRGEHWNHAWHQGETVAHAMLGLPNKEASISWAWTEQYGVRVQMFGDPQGTGGGDQPGALETTVDGSPEDFDATITIRRAGRIIAGACFNRHKEFRALLESASGQF